MLGDTSTDPADRENFFQNFYQVNIQVEES